MLDLNFPILHHLMLHNDQFFFIKTAEYYWNIFIFLHAIAISHECVPYVKVQNSWSAINPMILL